MKKFITPLSTTGLILSLISSPLAAQTDIAKVQKALQDIGYEVPAVNGKYDEATKAAVMLFQLDNDLPAEAQLDDATITALLPPEPVETPDPVIQPIDNVITLEEATARLAELGYDVSNPKLALQIFQLDNDLPAESQLDAVTAAALSNAAPLNSLVVASDVDAIENQPQQTVVSIASEPPSEPEPQIEPFDLEREENQLEESLASLGYDVVDRKTAIMLFQLDHDIPAEGQEDETTLLKVWEETNKPQPEPEITIEAPIISAEIIEVDEDTTLAAEQEFVNIDDPAPVTELPAEIALEELPTTDEVIVIPELASTSEEIAGDEIVLIEEPDTAVEVVESPEALELPLIEETPVLENNQIVEEKAIEPVLVEDANSAEQRLNQLGYLAQVDGAWTLTDIQALKFFQLENELIPDGQLTAETQQRLFSDQAIPEVIRKGTANTEAAVETQAAVRTRPVVTLAPQPKNITEIEIDNNVVDVAAEEAVTDVQQAIDEAKLARETTQLQKERNELAAMKAELLAEQEKLAKQQKELLVAQKITEAEREKIATANTDIQQQREAAHYQLGLLATEKSELERQKNQLAEELAQEKAKLDIASQVEIQQQNVNAQMQKLAVEKAELEQQKIRLQAEVLAAQEKLSQARNKAEKAAQQANLVTPIETVNIKQVAPPVVNLQPEPRPVPQSITNNVETPALAVVVPDVARVQKQLQRAGYYEGEVDGKQGPLLQKAVKYFQLINSLKATGKLDASTINLLNQQVPN